MKEFYRIISYNILEGWGDEKLGGRALLPGAERRAAAYAWLGRRQPAVVGFQELCGFTGAQLERDALSWGHGHSAFLDCGYSMGVTARSPIEVVEKKKDMHHGLLHVRIDGIDMLVTHFTPHGQRQEERRQEVAIVLERVRRARLAGQPCLLMGDLNAVSPQDDHLIGEACMAWYPSDWPQIDGRPEYYAIQALLDGGLVDPWTKHRDPDLAAFAERPRYDFTLISADLAAHSVDAHYWKDAETDAWSDHWPVGVDLTWPPAAPGA